MLYIIIIKDILSPKILTAHKFTHKAKFVSHYLHTKFMM